MEQEARKENGLMFVKFENQKVPEFKQVRGKDWVYWGEDNTYADYLIGLYDRSSTHQAIVSGKVDYIIGNGWKAKKNEGQEENNLMIDEFINKINADETLNELSEALVLDFELFNGIALEVIYNKSGNNFELYHIPFNKIRTNESESKYYYSKDWSIVQQSEEKTGLKEYLPFDSNVKNGSSIYYYKIISPRKGKDPNVYPSPGYLGSTQSIETEIECSNYNLSEIKTGFSGGTMINFYNGVPDLEQKKAIRKEIVDKLSGTDRAGSLILNFSDGKERGSDVVALNGNNLPERYINVKEDSIKNIFVGHKVNDPSLFGVIREGVMFDSKSNSFSQEQFQNQYITKRQNIIEKIFNYFAKLKGITDKLFIQPVTINRNDIFTEATIIAYLPRKAIEDIIAERMGVDLKKYAETELKKDYDEYKEGMPHYTADGELWTGPTHKDSSGRLMTGATHNEDSEYLYHEGEYAEVGERGGIRKSDKAPKSKTKNENPQGEGSAKGNASGKRGAEVTERQEQALQKKVDEFNEKDSNTKNGRATLGALKSVFQRGIGAFNTSHSPEVTSSEQWAYARCNAFLYLLKNGRPQNPKYITDYDLLPKDHPKSKEKMSMQFVETYNDYPEQASENAKIALRYAEEYGWGSCGTPVGKARANQLANKESISRDTIARMSSFERQRENSDKELGDGCGRLMWLAWGGDAGVEWAGKKLKQIDSLKLTSEFKKIGRSKNLFNIYKSFEIENATFNSVLEKKAEYFANELTADQRAVIDLLSKEENTPTSEIAKALKISNKEVEKIIDNLVKSEYLNATDLGFTPSASALDIVIEEGAKTANIELLYSYELRTNAPKLKGVSRDFCIDMVKMDKLYTYEEIEKLSNDLGTDVWSTRGGWYSNPNTDAPTPQCRHIWVQNVTKLK